jgi:hypothetical protein
LENLVYIFAYRRLLRPTGSSLYFAALRDNSYGLLTISRVVVR